MVLTFSLIILGLLGVCQCHLRLSCELAKFMSREDYRAVAGTNYEAQCSSVTSRELEEAAAYLGGTRSRIVAGRRERQRNVQKCSDSVTWEVKGRNLKGI